MMHHGINRLHVRQASAKSGHSANKSRDVPNFGSPFYYVIHIKVTKYIGGFTLAEALVSTSRSFFFQKAVSKTPGRRRSLPPVEAVGNFTL